jgi:hypothetical protein
MMWFTQIFASTHRILFPRASGTAGFQLDHKNIPRLISIRSMHDPVLIFAILPTARISVDRRCSSATGSEALSLHALLPCQKFRFSGSPREAIGGCFWHRAIPWGAGRDIVGLVSDIVWRRMGFQGSRSTSSRRSPGVGGGRSTTSGGPIRRGAASVGRTEIEWRRGPRAVSSSLSIFRVPRCRFGSAAYYSSSTASQTSF